jgi:hypothetical protein
LWNFGLYRFGLYGATDSSPKNGWLPALLLVAIEPSLLGQRALADFVASPMMVMKGSTS